MKSKYSDVSDDENNEGDDRAAPRDDSDWGDEFDENDAQHDYGNAEENKAAAIAKDKDAQSKEKRKNKKNKKNDSHKVSKNSFTADQEEVLRKLYKQFRGSHSIFDVIASDPAFRFIFFFMVKMFGYNV